jgi:hypothetical protein
MSLTIFIVFSPVYGIQIHAIVVMRIESTRQHVNKWHESARIAGKEAMQAQSFDNRNMPSDRVRKGLSAVIGDILRYRKRM